MNINWVPLNLRALRSALLGAVLTFSSPAFLAQAEAKTPAKLCRAALLTKSEKAKYQRMVTFGEALPTLRETAKRDMGVQGISRQKILAAVVILLNETSIRIGNWKYAFTNHTYGLTTLKKSHVSIDGSEITLKFRGKAAQRHVKFVKNARLARLLSELMELPGPYLFQYRDESGSIRQIDPTDINEYLQEISGEALTAKDFRTWTATSLSTEYLLSIERPTSEADYHRAFAAAARVTSEHLGHSPGMSRKYYIDPLIFDVYQQPALFAQFARRAQSILHRRSTGRTLAEETTLVILRAER